MADSIGTVILNQLTDDTAVVVKTVYSVLMGSWPGQTIVGLYAAIVGYLILMGRTGERAKDWGVSIVLLLTISGIAGNYDAISEWLIDPIFDTARSAAVVASTGGNATEGVLSNIVDATAASTKTVLGVVDRLELPGNIVSNALLYIKVGIVAGLLAALACAQYFALVALLCIAIFSFLMMCMVGGPCLWFASFKETRFITTTWLKQLCNYALWIFFLGAVSGIGNAYIGKVAAALTKWDIAEQGVFTEEVGSSMLLTALSIYMLLKAADWAAALTGGTASNTGAVGAMLGGAAGAAGGAAGSAAGAAGRAAGGAAKWAGGKAANLAGLAANRAFSALRGIGK